MNSKDLFDRALATIALCAAPVAFAQQAPAEEQGAAEEISEVVVTGYRQSLQEALNVKRNSELVVDAVSGGDIGALPDVTIAETLVRLPGVNGIRDRGNQSQAAVRGLGPRLVFGLVNGREVASSEPTRNVRWEIYPSEVVSGADVYKSQSADIVAGGVAGTIDIKTIRPLNYTGPSMLLRGGPVYYQSGGDIPGYDPFGYRGSGSVTHSIGENFAFNIGVTVQRQKNAYPSFQGWGYNDSATNAGNAPGDLDGDGTPDPTPWGAQTEVKKLTEDRVGISAALGWRPSDQFELNVDALYSKFTIDEDQNQAWYGNNVMGNWANGNAACYNGPNSSYTLENGDVVAATLADCFAPVTNVIAKYTEDKDLLVTGVNGKFESGAWTTSGDLSHSTAQRTNRWAAFRSEVYPATMSFDMSSGKRPSLTTSSDPSDPNIQSAPSWLPGLSDGPDELQDDLSALRVDVTRKFEGANLKSLQFGARRSERDKDFFRRQQTYVSTFAGNLPADLFTSFSVKEFDAPPLLNGNFRELADLVYDGMVVDPDAIVQSSVWGVEESVSEAYGMVKFGGSLGVPFTANAGVRVVRTETTSTGFEAVNGAFTPISSDNEYTEALPSVNFVFKLADDRLLRVGLARVIARPPLDELRASRQLWNVTPPANGSSGNPMLEPFIANQADLSYEFYFAPEALVALAVFYKDVDTHIGYKTEAVTIDGTSYAITGPFNGEGGGIAGAEFTFQTPFTFSETFRNFGVYLNYAYVDTSVKEFYPANDPLPVDGYAKNTAAADLYYDGGGFEARIGYKYHSPFTIVAGWNGNDVRTLQSESILDFSTSYQMSDSFEVRLQVNNLTDEPLRITRDNTTDRLGAYDVYGRRALIDFTFKY